MALIDPSKNDPNSVTTRLFRRAGVQIHLNEAQRVALAHTLKYPQIAFFAVPTKVLIQDILNGRSQIARELPPDVVKVFGMGNGLPIDQQMILDYDDRTLDPRNRYVLDLCDIVYVGEIPECLRGLKWTIA